MTIAEPMLLPEDVIIVPVEDLPEEVRVQVHHRPGDQALTRPLSRTPSTIVDQNTARLLSAFRAPTRIVDAILGFATEQRLDPRETLERSYPVLKELLTGGLLVPADSELAKPISTSSLPDGASVGRFRVSRTVHLMIDTQLCLARDATVGDGPAEDVALKVARPGHEVALRAAFAHEAHMLRILDGVTTPRLIELGDADGRPYLAMTWHRGSSADIAAAELRRLSAADGRSPLLALGERILAAYASIHSRGVLHGDVHPNNVLVGPDSAVTVIDLGLAAREGDRGIPRGGVDFFQEPESARAQQNGVGAAALSAVGEQYAIAALLYLLLTGGHTHAFSLEPTEMRRQLLEDLPLPFSRHGAHGLTHLEEVLGKALAKDPADRFPDVEAFLAAYRVAAASDLRTGGAAKAGSPAPISRGVSAGEADRLLGEVLERLSPDGPLLRRDLEAPRASVNLGAAGIAYGLLRIAMARDDARLLASAGLWSLKALASLETDEAFINAELDITPANFGTTGIHHSATGVYVTEAAIAHARWDPVGRGAAIEGYLAATSDSGPERDVSFGRSGILLGTAMLLDALPLDAPERSALRSRGNDLARNLWAELSAQGRLAITAATDDEPDRERFVGVAHGWAGFLYAQLRWSESAGEAPPEGLAARLVELRSLAAPHGRGLVWPRELGAPDDGALSATWCNGAAGLVGLWLLASRIIDDSFAVLAEGAAWTALDGSPVPGDLCCGLAGRAYALIALYRATGDRIWLARAHGLADQAAVAIREHALRQDSLYKGSVGVAVLAADLERPSEAAMPFFDPEPWLGSVGPP